MSLESDFLYPFILLCVGGGTTGLLVPYLTRVWQDYQAESD